MERCTRDYLPRNTCFTKRTILPQRDDSPFVAFASSRSLEGSLVRVSFFLTVAFLITCFVEVALLSVDVAVVVAWVSVVVAFKMITYGCGTGVVLVDDVKYEPPPLIVYPPPFMNPPPPLPPDEPPVPPVGADTVTPIVFTDVFPALSVMVRVIVYVPPVE